MRRDMGDDVPPTPAEWDDFEGNIDWLAGTALLILEDVEPAAERLEAAIARFARTGNESITPALSTLGVALRKLGRLDDALGRYQQAVSLLREAGDEINLPIVQQNAGNLCQQAQRNEEALSWYAEAKDKFHTQGLVEKEGEIDQGVGCVLFQMGRPAEAASAWERASACFETAGATKKVVQIEMNLGSSAAARCDFDSEVMHLEHAVALSRSLTGTEPECAVAAQMLARAYIRLGRIREALDLMRGSADSAVGEQGRR
jgi:tetratricopeptide (TPR) repeat protein